MSITLGEKLRQAREDRGQTISEVADQTRISSLYLESIENDDYRILPGGIFNKGFVKSYAKFVGVNEQEALEDYADLLAATSKDEELQPKTYRPEVLTDDRSGSMVPTIILAAVILGALTAGILFAVSYLRQTSDASLANTAATNSNTAAAANTNTELPASNVPVMSTVKIEFKAVSQAVSLSATSDGKLTGNAVAAGTSVIFEPRQSLKLSYSKSLADAVQLTINGKAIALPAQPLVSRRNAIEFEINSDNLAQIWTSGAISDEVPAAAAVITNTAPTPSAVQAPVATPIRTPAPKPTVAANTAPTRTPTPRPAYTARPLANTQ